MAKKIVQTGLFTTDPVEVTRMVERLNAFNMRNIGNAIKLDILACDEGDGVCAVPHIKFKFVYPSREIQAKFWTT